MDILGASISEAFSIFCYCGFMKGQFMVFSCLSCVVYYMYTSGSVNDQQYYIRRRFPDDSGEDDLSACSAYQRSVSYLISGGRGDRASPE